MTSAEEISLTVVPMTAAAISLIASTLIVVMMGRSRKKLKDPYRRIIFGISLFDIASSLAVTFFVFKSTPESNMWLPLGNQNSCEILGFLHIIGSIGTMMYSVNLNIFYFYLIRQNMRDDIFSKKIEPWLHGVTLLWTIVGGIYIWVDKLINPTIFGGCFLAPYPAGCLFSNDDDLECVTGHNQKQVMMIYMAVPCVFTIVISTVLLLAIWWKIRSQELRMNRYSLNRVSYRMRSSLEDSLNNRTDDEDGKLGKTWRQVKTWYERRRTRRTGRRSSNSRVFLWRAVWYAVAYFVTFTFPLLLFLLYLNGSESSFYIALFTKLLQPLQGLFNILVYTRPHVKSFQRNNPGVTWFQAFCAVIASGGDDDLDADERRSLTKRKSAMALGSGNVPTSVIDVGELGRSTGCARTRRSIPATPGSDLHNSVRDFGALRRSTGSIFGQLRSNRSGDYMRTIGSVEMQEVVKSMSPDRSGDMKVEVSSDNFDEMQSSGISTAEEHSSYLSISGRRSSRLSLTTVDEDNNDGVESNAGTSTINETYNGMENNQSRLSLTSVDGDNNLDIEVNAGTYTIIEAHDKMKITQRPQGELSDSGRNSSRLSLTSTDGRNNNDVEANAGISTIIELHDEMKDIQMSQRDDPCSLTTDVRERNEDDDDGCRKSVRFTIEDDESPVVPPDE